MPSSMRPTSALDHADFFERFKSFWAAPSGTRIPELIAPDAQITFTGAGIFTGKEYIAVMQQMLDSFPGMEVKPVDYAGNGDRLYISWEASAQIDGEQRRWFGVDRFRLHDGLAVEEQVVFDSAALQPQG